MVPSRLGSSVGESDAEDSNADESMAGGDAAEVDGREYRCGVCNEPDTLENLPHCCRGLFLHRNCWNAVRSYRRTIDGNATELMKDKHMRVHNLPQWRAKVRPYVPEEFGSRRAARDSHSRP